VAFTCGCPKAAIEVVRKTLQAIQLPLELEAQNNAAKVLNALHVLKTCAEYCSNMAPPVQKDTFREAVADATPPRRPQPMSPIPPALTIAAPDPKPAPDKES